MWEVSQASRWAGFIGAEVTGAVMHYRPWINYGGYWCSRVTLFFGDRRVDLLFGESDNDQRLVPSAA